MANQTETPETPSGRRWRAASSAWLFWMGRDPGQVTCSTHSHGREVPAQPHFQPGADTSQLRWRNPGATKKPAVVSPAYSVFFSTSVYLQVSSSIIPKVGSWLFSDFPYRCSPPVWGHKQHTQTPCSPGSQTAPHLSYSDPCWVLSAAQGWTGKVWHIKKQSLSLTQSFGNKDYFRAQAFYI